MASKFRNFKKKKIFKKKKKKLHIGAVAKWLRTFVVRTMSLGLVWRFVLVDPGLWSIMGRDVSTTIGMIGAWIVEKLAFPAVAGQNLIVGHSERRGRATHIITKESVYWAAA